MISNKDGIGTTLKLYTDDGLVQYRESRSGGSLGGGNTPYIHFGLGPNASIDSLVLDWPSGIHQSLVGIDSDTFIVVIEDQLLSREDLILNIESIDQKARLFWSPAETLRSPYLIHRSDGLSEFEQIGVLESCLSDACEFVDMDILQGVYYYRLQIGSDFSNTVLFQHEGRLFSIYPTFSQQDYVHFKREQDSPFYFELFSSNGVMVRSGWGEGVQGMLEFSESDELDQGIYFLSLSEGASTSILRWIKY